MSIIGHLTKVKSSSALFFTVLFYVLYLRTDKIYTSFVGRSLTKYIYYVIIFKQGGTQTAKISKSVPKSSP